ncbi:MAG: PQQ-binding-like beta-propeller repeat protein, partial [Caldilineaceae bacterium]
MQSQSLPGALTAKRTVMSDTLPIALAWQTRLDQIVVRAPIVLDNLVLLFTPEDLRALDVNSGTEQWRFKVDHGTLSMPLPVSHDNVIYIGSNAGLAALSLQDGTVLWKRPLQDGYKQNITAGITYSAGRVFAVSATSSDVLAFDAGNGMPLWRTETLNNMRGADLQV